MVSPRTVGHVQLYEVTGPIALNDQGKQIQHLSSEHAQQPQGRARMQTGQGEAANTPKGLARAVDLVPFSPVAGSGGAAGLIERIACSAGPWLRLHRLDG